MPPKETPPESRNDLDFRLNKKIPVIAFCRLLCGKEFIGTLPSTDRYAEEINDFVLQMFENAIGALQNGDAYSGKIKNVTVTKTVIKKYDAAGDLSEGDEILPPAFELGMYVDVEDSEETVFPNIYMHKKIEMGVTSFSEQPVEEEIQNATDATNQVTDVIEKVQKATEKGK